MLNVAEALDAIIAAVTPPPPTATPLTECLGRILAEDIRAAEDVPRFHKSAMDGFAVRLADLTGANALPLRGEIPAGSSSVPALPPGAALRIMTGAPVPAGADTVIPVEWAVLDGSTSTVQFDATKTWRVGANVQPRGSLLSAGQAVLRAGQGIRAQELAQLAELGAAAPLVQRLPRVAVLATGDELVPYDATPAPGQIRNSNALMLRAQCLQAGVEVIELGIARDDRVVLDQQIRAGLNADFLILSGGVSAGERDFVPAALQAAGVEQRFHKVAMKPGKPVWFGQRRMGDGRDAWVFGLPGNPVSSMVCFELFVRTAFRRFLGIAAAAPSLVAAQMTRDWEHRSDRPTLFPGRLSASEGRLQVDPAAWRGSADLSACLTANCSLSLPAGTTQWTTGQIIEVLPWGRPLLLDANETAEP